MSGHLYSLANQYTKLPDGFTPTYDAFDRRIEQAVGSPREILYGPDGSKLGTMSGQSVAEFYLPTPGGGAAVYISGSLGYYWHSDWLGTARLASGMQRNVYYDKSFAPFGDVYNETGSAERSFTGQANNLTTGLYDFMFREYDPTQGRWLKPDPAGVKVIDPTNPQSWNRYAYVSGNPLARIDRKGLCTVMFTATSTGAQANCNTSAALAWAFGLSSYTAAPSSGLSQQGTVNSFDQATGGYNAFNKLMNDTHWQAYAAARCPGDPQDPDACVGNVSSLSGVALNLVSGVVLLGSPPGTLNPVSINAPMAPPAVTAPLTQPFAPDPAKQTPPKCPKGTHPSFDPGSGLDLAPFEGYSCVANRPG